MTKLLVVFVKLRLLFLWVSEMPIALMGGAFVDNQWRILVFGEFLLGIPLGWPGFFGEIEPFEFAGGAGWCLDGPVLHPHKPFLPVELTFQLIGWNWN